VTFNQVRFAVILDFVIDRFFMKLFTTKSTDTVKYCQEYFDFLLLLLLLNLNVMTIYVIV